MLAERIEELEKGKESRIAIIGETKRKRKSSAVKKSKRKYRLMEARKGAAAIDKSDEDVDGIENPKSGAAPDRDRSSTCSS